MARKIGIEAVRWSCGKGATMMSEIVIQNGSEASAGTQELSAHADNRLRRINGTCALQALVPGAKL